LYKAYHNGWCKTDVKEKNPSLLILLLKIFLPRFFFFFLYTAYDVKLKRFSPDLKPAVADKNFDANKNSRTPTPIGNRSSSSSGPNTYCYCSTPSKFRRGWPCASSSSINIINEYNEYNNQYFFSINRLIQQSNVDKIHNKSSIASKTTQIAQQFLVCSQKTQNTSERERERERGEGGIYGDATDTYLPTYLPTYVPQIPTYISICHTEYQIYFYFWGSILWCSQKWRSSIGRFSKKLTAMS
jgi:hypothetical protein